jgi:hypothetical protein
MASSAKKGVITIQGVDYAWEITRLGGVSNSLGDYRGLAVSVCLEPGRTKELVVEFPFEEFEFGPPKSKSSFVDRLRGCVEAAMSEGWVPTKRGKAFIYQPE